MNNVDWFELLSLDNMVVAYRDLFSKDGEPINKQYNMYAELIYGKFFRLLNEAIHSRFGNILWKMNFETTWSFRCYKTLTSDVACISVIYDVDDCGVSDYDPLIKFIIHLDEGKLNNAYLSVISEKLLIKLGDCLEKTFEKWSASMAKYYQDLQGRFQECLSGMDLDAPMDNPERFFLTHETIELK